MKIDPAFALLGDSREWSLPHIVRRQAQRYGDRKFISFAGGATLSFNDLHVQSDEVAASLKAVGIGPGDRVFAMLHNRAELLLLAIGTGRVGAVFVPLNTELKGFSLQHQLHNGSPKAVFVEGALVGAFESVAPGDAPPSIAVVIGARAGSEVTRMPPALASAECYSFESFMATGTAFALNGTTDPSPLDIGCIMYTSGTTGPSKGVLMSHAHLALFGVPSWGLEVTERDAYYVCMPLFHANALFIQVFGSLMCGAQVHCVQRFSPSRWLADVRECGATLTNALGVMAELLYRSPEKPDDHLNPLRAVLAVPVADEWIGKFCERFGVRVVQGFGMTECNMIAYATTDDPLVSGCCGTVRSQLFDVAIVDPVSDAPLIDGAVGEIVVRPRLAFCFMQGYFGMPDKTVEAWRNLWFHTGDAGRLEDGRLYFADRIKDRIRRRGENVSAFEIEQVLASLEEVAECAVVGITVGDAAAEQEIKACIVLNEGSTLTALRVLQHCIDRVPRFAVPRYIEFIAAMPKTASNKVQKQLLRDTGCASAWDREAEGHGARAASGAKQ